MMYRDKKMKYKFRFPTISIILILLVIHYFPDKPLAAETNTAQESEDIVVVANPKTPLMKLRMVFTEELSIGEVEGDENYMFGENISFNTDKDGNFYVSDVDAHRIQKYDPDGKAYSVVTEDDYKFVKRHSIEIQEFRDGKWVQKK